MEHADPSSEQTATLVFWIVLGGAVAFIAMTLILVR
jgi:hypothetical protein